MNGVEQINSLFNSLPRAYQEEALHFVEFLSKKARNGDHSDMTDADWSEFSIESALKDLATDEEVEYTEADLKARWR